MVSNAIVIGGGVAGLATATLLGQRGVAVTLVEQAPRLTEVGAGLQISPNGLAVLRRLGIEASLKRKGAVEAEAVVLRDGLTGGKVAHLDLRRLRKAQQYCFVHRADLIDVLAGAARRQNVTFDLGRQVASVLPGDTPRLRMTDGSMRQAHMIVAADGLHSVARPALNGSDRAQFTGQVAWRALIPNAIGHPDAAQVFMGPGRHLVTYPVRGGSLINLVAVEEREAWAEEGWQHPDDPENIRRAFAGFKGQAAEMISAVETVSLWGLHKHPVAGKWHQDGLVILGDAAHPTLPFLAQGANMALEDAWVLADCVARDGLKGLSSYQQIRMPRVTRVLRAADRNAWRYHLHPGLIRRVAHAVLGMVSRFAPGRLLGAYDWLYGHDVTQTRK